MHKYTVKYLFVFYAQVLPYYDEFSTKIGNSRRLQDAGQRKARGERGDSLAQHDDVLHSLSQMHRPPYGITTPICRYTGRSCQAKTNNSAYCLDLHATRRISISRIVESRDPSAARETGARGLIRAHTGATVRSPEFNPNRQCIGVADVETPMRRVSVAYLRSQR